MGLKPASKRYIWAMGGALLLHALLAISLLWLKTPEPIAEHRLVEFQFLNSAPPPEIPAAPPKPPTPKTPPTPKPVAPKPSAQGMAPAKAEPHRESTQQAHEEVSDLVESPTTPTTQSSAPAFPLVSQDALDNPRVEPFGNRKPFYPPLARAAGIEGSVLVRVLVDQRGQVIDAKIVQVKGHPSFAEETLKVARQWRFPVLTSRGQRVQAWIEKQVYFQLRD
jgi:periplasmic protein TonB